jgi:predicted acylesterase/phospholipase RssA/CRP-like cAMP-binding protein
MQILSILEQKLDVFTLGQGEYLDCESRGFAIVALGSCALVDQKESVTLGSLKQWEAMGLFWLIDSEHGKDVALMGLETKSVVWMISRNVFLKLMEQDLRAFSNFVKFVMGQEWRVSSFVFDEFLKIPDHLRSRFQRQTAPKIDVLPQSILTKTDSLSTLSENSNEKSCASEVKDEAEEEIDSSGVERSPRKVAMDNPVSVRQLNPGEFLFQTGEDSDSFFVLFEGSAIAGTWQDIQNHVGTSIGPSCLIGAVSFFMGRKRSDCVKALKPSIFFEYNHHVLDVLIESEPEHVYEILLRISKQLACVSCELASFGFHRCWYEGREQVFHSGDPADYMYVIVSGGIRLIKESTETKLGEVLEMSIKLNEENVTLDLRRGQSFGESAVQDVSGTRSFTAVSIRDSHLVRISRTCFLRLLVEYPAAILRSSQEMVKKIQTLSASESRHKLKCGELRTFAVFPASSTSIVHVDSACIQLASAMSCFSKTLRVNALFVDHKVGYSISKKVDDPFESFLLSSWIARQEEKFGALILQCSDDVSSGVSAWDRFILRHADCILLVGWHGSSIISEQQCSTSISEQELLELSYVSKRLILIHPQSTKLPQNTRFWTCCRNIQAHYHARSQCPSDWERIARILLGHAIGVVFGGGGARGLAHLGVIRSLEERGVPIDLVGGTSQGSFMAALYGICLSWKKMEMKTRTFALNFHPLNFLLSMTLPILSYFDGKLFTENIFNQLGFNTRIEDLWVPFYCISTDISKSDQVIHTRGLLWKYVRASMTILGYIPPIVDQGGLLVDGGYVNNLPVDVMKLLHSPRFIIAVDVENRDRSLFRDLWDYGWWCSGFQLLLVKLNPWSQRKVPDFGDLLVFLNCISHNRQLALVQSEIINLYVRPDVCHYSILDFHKVDEIIALGYSAGKDAVRQWKSPETQAAQDSEYCASPPPRTISLQLLPPSTPSTARRYSFV